MKINGGAGKYPEMIIFGRVAGCHKLPFKEISCEVVTLATNTVNLSGY